jgi:hypothetical protein
MRRRTVITEDVEGVDCDLTFEPCEWMDTFKGTAGDKVVYGYCVQDNDYRHVDDLMGDCMGKLYSFHRHADRSDQSAGLEALGNDYEGNANLDKVWEHHEDEATARYIKRVIEEHTLSDIMAVLGEGDEDAPSDEAAVSELLLQDSANYNGWAYVEYDSLMQAVLEEMWAEPAYFPGDKDAQLLACYDHSSQYWSLSGSGMQCRWDTSNQAGVWVPDECLRKQLDDDEAKGEDRAANARKYCKQFLDSYNDIINGNVFGIVVEWFDEDGQSIDHDSCWCFVGGDHAEESLKESFDDHCASLQKEHDEAVRTQNGAQVEIPWTPQEEEAFRNINGAC